MKIRVSVPEVLFVCLSPEVPNNNSLPRRIDGDTIKDECKDLLAAASTLLANRKKKDSKRSEIRNTFLTGLSQITIFVPAPYLGKIFQKKRICLPEK